MSGSRTTGVVRFGPFDFDHRAGELRRKGLRIRLQGQPAAILALLLERPGEVVERAEIQRRLWPAETFVDFERGLNASVTRLRAALGDSAGQPRYLETIPRRGYRFIAPVAHSHQETESLTRVLILPFEQLRPDNDTSFLCFSLPDAITCSLAGISSLVARSSRASAALAAGEANWNRLAHEAGVDAVLMATLLRSGDQLRVAAQLVRVPAGTVVWTHQTQVPLGEMFALQDELTRRIVHSLVPSMAGLDRRPRRAGTPATARAYESYLRANHLSAQTRDLPLARDMYLRCLDEDPDFAPAWGRLARCYRILAKFRADQEQNVANAGRAFARAFALNPHLPGIQSQ